MSKLSLDQRVPTNYEPSRIKEIIQAICNELNTLAEGNSAAKYSSRNVTPSGSVEAHAISDVLYDTNATVGASLVPGLPLNYVRLGWIWNVAGSPGTFQEMRIPTGTLSMSVPNNVALASNGAGGVGFRTITSSDLPIANMFTVLGADVTLSSTVSYFDGPAINQPPAGTWLIMGTVTVEDTAGAANWSAKLWDGTNIIASARNNTNGATVTRTIALSGVITNPSGAVRISVKDETSTSGRIRANSSGNSRDSTLAAIKLA